jgi:hypothetical protein
VGGVVDHVFPGFVGIDEGGFFFGHGERVEHDLAEISEGGGGALGDAVLGQGGEDFAHDVVDVGGGEEVAGEGGGDFRAKAVRFQELNLFFGNLAPFPIVPGSASVHKLTPSGNFKIWDAGFTTVVGVVFDYRDRLYVLELSDAAGNPTPGEGKLVRVSPSGEVEEILGGLVVPTAMTIGPDGAIYISNFGAAPPGAGQILRLEIND